jgi:hypothetical protein
LLIGASIAWSRSFGGHQGAIVPRFAVLATPLLCGVFLAFQICLPRRVAFGGQLALLLLLLLSLPWNINDGLARCRLKRAQANRIYLRAVAGQPPSVLASHNKRVGDHETLDIAMFSLLAEKGTGAFVEKWRAAMVRKEQMRQAAAAKRKVRR